MGFLHDLACVVLKTNDNSPSLPEYENADSLDERDWNDEDRMTAPVVVFPRDVYNACLYSHATHRLRSDLKTLIFVIPAECRRSTAA